MNKIALYAVIGAVLGLAVAQFFPSLGKSGLDKGLSDLAVSLGGRKPYLLDAGLGAALGALLGLALMKQK